MVQVGFEQVTATVGGLLERAEELAALNDRLDAVEASGRGHVVLLLGEAGVGKTALIREFCEGRAGSARTVHGACEPLFTPVRSGR
jgi:predicted ATPase